MLLISELIRYYRIKISSIMLLLFLTSKFPINFMENLDMPDMCCELHLLGVRTNVYNNFHYLHSYTCITNEIYIPFPVISL